MTNLTIPTTADDTTSKYDRQESGGVHLFRKVEEALQ